MKILLFFLYLFKPKNWPLLAYLLANVYIVFLVCITGWIIDGSKTQFLSAGYISIGVYFLLLIIMLTPIGEVLLCLNHQAKILKRTKDNEEIYYHFGEVYYEARKKIPHLSKKVKLYYIENEQKNASTIGGRTIIITTGLMCLPKEQFKGVIAHEFGHLASFDSYNKAAIMIGNLFVYLVWEIIKIAIWSVIVLLEVIIHSILYPFTSMVREINMSLSSFVYKKLSTLYEKWNMIGVLFVAKTSRKAEYEADSFASSLGYGEGLARAIYEISKNTKRIHIDYYSSHPGYQSRILKLGYKLNNQTY